MEANRIAKTPGRISKSRRKNGEILTGCRDINDLSSRLTLKASYELLKIYLGGLKNGICNIDINDSERTIQSDEANIEKSG